jgi:metallophosphoesterase (TIGR03767 family)
VWTEIFRASGATYREPQMVAYTRGTQTGCGFGQAAMGPFYCPNDSRIYLDPTFFNELQTRFQAAGDFARAYVIAHEVGHHVQNLEGTLDQAHNAQARAGKAGGNAIQVKVELQADCYAGVWAKHAKAPDGTAALEAGDVEEGMRAAEAIGDDTLQRQTQGTVVPESFTHGSSAQRMAALRTGLQSGDPAALHTLFSGPVRLVTPDPDRRPLSKAETIAEHFTTTGHPRGHGFTAENVAKNTAYYTFDASPQVRGIVLDTVNPYGGSEGSVDAEQLAWLTAQLTAVSSSYLDSSGAKVTHRVRDRLVVIFSHHTVASMTNAAGVGRILGPAVRELLLRFPNVVLWVNGHTHVNGVTPHARPAGAAVGGGFWEVNTASHVDWPQQARIVELVDNGDGTLSVFGTILDHAAPRTPGELCRPSSPGHPVAEGPLALASLSRELSANDWQNPASTATVDGRRGALTDRNVELRLAAPFVLR